MAASTYHTFPQRCVRLPLGAGAVHTPSGHPGQWGTSAHADSHLSSKPADLESWEALELSVWPVHSGGCLASNSSGAQAVSSPQGLVGLLLLVSRLPIPQCLAPPTLPALCHPFDCQPLTQGSALVTRAVTVMLGGSVGPGHPAVTRRPHARSRGECGAALAFLPWRVAVRCASPGTKGALHCLLHRRNWGGPSPSSPTLSRPQPHVSTLGRSLSSHTPRPGSPIGSRRRPGSSCCLLGRPCETCQQNTHSSEVQATGSRLLSHK